MEYAKAVTIVKVTEIILAEVLDLLADVVGVVGVVVVGVFVGVFVGVLLV